MEENGLLGPLYEVEQEFAAVYAEKLACKTTKKGEKGIQVKKFSVQTARIEAKVVRVQRKLPIDTQRKFKI